MSPNGPRISDVFYEEKMRMQFFLRENICGANGYPLLSEVHEAKRSVRGQRGNRGPLSKIRWG